MKTLLITVGTTEFDELMQTLDNANFDKLLVRYHYEQVLIQMGRGKYRFSSLFSQSTDQCIEKSSSGIHFQIFRYHPDLTELIQQASTVIGHAGAGTILEVASAKKLFLCVVNPTLQDNHQLELASALRAAPSQLCEVADLPDAMSCFESLHAKNAGAAGVIDGTDFPILNPRHFASFMNEIVIKSDK